MNCPIKAVVFPAPGQVEVQEFVLPPPGDEDSLARATPRSNPYVERDEAVEERASTATVGEQPSSL